MNIDISQTFLSHSVILIFKNNEENLNTSPIRFKSGACRKPRTNDEFRVERRLKVRK